MHKSKMAEIRDGKIQDSHPRWSKKNFNPNYFSTPNFFLTQSIFLSPNFFSDTKFILDKKMWTKISLGLQFLFQSPNFFGLKICFGPIIFFGRTILFRHNIYFGRNIFFRPISFIWLKQCLGRKYFLIKLFKKR